MTLLTALVLASLAAVTALALRRIRRATRLPLDPLPAGMKHLASHVGALSHLGSGLRVAPGTRWRRLGTLLGVR